MKNILLTTLNAKYIHASLGLRYLYANLGELQAQCELVEYTIKTRAIDIVESILNKEPKIVGFGVYIWNIEETQHVVAQLKSLRPDLIIVLGGPEVSYETQSHPIINYCDYVITGPADKSFARLCHDVLAKRPPIEKIIRSQALDLNTIKMPYDFYDDDDLAHRLIYVEASRGCPFKCEFCLSALDKTSYPFELERFLAAMEDLYQRGARHFKFVDRTFNLKIKTTLQILDFFLAKISDDLFLHFEVIPDHLPEALKEKLKQFPPGTLQFEVGIQTFNSEVQKLISRKQNNDKSKENLKWLRENTTAHIHADLIFGLPGESMDSFASSFDELVACQPHEIQMGILKRLKGSPIIRHSDDYQLVFNPLPPYNVLQTSTVSFSDMQRMNRFARYWDMIANSGRFSATLPLLLGAQPFARFCQLSDWLFEKTQQTHQINLKRLFEILLEIDELFDDLKYPDYYPKIEQDYLKTKLKGRLQNRRESSSVVSQKKRSIRQQRHLTEQ
ncbi:MAG: DUF4080 domain-containing protein [Gammaproteobacteria bacterium]|nr:DUF4080 domain-containing protein [Gammaproteobacteria bacterium]NVK88914.1 DUF4080 domain-containing protein [Gammaproteobacteria bacterium]